MVIEIVDLPMKKVVDLFQSFHRFFLYQRLLPSWFPLWIDPVADRFTQVLLWIQESGLRHESEP